MLPGSGSASRYDEQPLPDPATVSSKEFTAIVHAFEEEAADSPGGVLTEEQLTWLLEAEAGWHARGVEDPGRENRLRMIASASLHLGRYGEALEWYARHYDFCGVETAAWLLEHDALEEPYTVQVRDIPGPLPECGREADRLQTRHHLFVAFQRGGVFRYDKQARTHVVLFVPSRVGSAPKHLGWEGRKLKIALEDGRRYRYDVQTSVLQALPPVSGSKAARGAKPKPRSAQ